MKTITKLLVDGNCILQTDQLVMIKQADKKITGRIAGFSDFPKSKYTIYVDASTKYRGSIEEITIDKFITYKNPTVISDWDTVDLSGKKIKLNHFITIGGNLISVDDLNRWCGGNVIAQVFKYDNSFITGRIESFRIIGDCTDTISIDVSVLYHKMTQTIPLHEINYINICNIYELIKEDEL